MARLPLAAPQAQQVLHGRALLDRITGRLHHVAQALRQLDATIREIRDSAFAVR